MFKMMIADDEKIAIDSLKFIIEKSFTDVEIISTARSGREAIELVEENVPDILFMDTIIKDKFHRMEDVYMNIPKSEWPPQQ